MIRSYSVIIYILICTLTLVLSQSSRFRKPRCKHTTDQSSLNSFLWRVKRKNGPPSYFFGTIHVPYTRVWDFIPDNTKQAFRQSDYVFFELDLTDSFTLMALTNCQMLPRGESLANILPKDMFQRLKRHLEYVKRAMPSWVSPDQRRGGIYPEFLFNAIAGNWEQKRPVWVMLMVNALTENDIRSKGIPVLDLYLAREADKMNKRTGAVEKVEEQCIPLNDLNISQVLFALNQTLWQHEHSRVGAGRVPYTTDDLINHYNCGDLNSVIFTQDTAQLPKILMNSTVKQSDLDMAAKIDEYFRRELIYKRNARMAGRVIELLERNPRKGFFFAFGAGHFLGNNTILDHLRTAGYRVEHTPSHEKISTKRSRKRYRTRNRVIVSGPGYLSPSPFFPNTEYKFAGLDQSIFRIHPRKKKRPRKGRPRVGRPGGRSRKGSRVRHRHNRHRTTKKAHRTRFHVLWQKISTSPLTTTTASNAPQWTEPQSIRRTRPKMFIIIEESGGVPGTMSSSVVLLLALIVSCFCL